LAAQKNTLPSRASDADSTRGRLEAREVQVAEREQALARLKRELLDLQSRYFQAVGELYAELSSLETAAVDLEIQLGLRPPPASTDDPDDAPDAGGADDQPGCSTRGAPTEDLKRVFRDIAKAIHPDRARDESARFRRHSLMAEANRAYAERDEDRLRLILGAWERSPDAVVDDHPDAERQRHERRIAQLDERLIAIATEFADLERSAIGRLRQKVDDARAQGWDLVAEIVSEVRRDISRAAARLAALRRHTGVRTAGRPTAARGNDT
jgi:hypothetical protein